MVNEYQLLKKLVTKLSPRKMKRHKYNMGALCASKKGNTLSIGINSYCKTHPIMQNYPYERKEQCYLHAEVAALASCKETPHVMIIARIGNSGNMLLAKPCLGCISIIKDREIKKVFYTNQYGKLELLNYDDYIYVGRKKI
jgi:deoxycytidylate deaminase